MGYWGVSIGCWEIAAPHSQVPLERIENRLSDYPIPSDGSTCPHSNTKILFAVLDHPKKSMRSGGARYVFDGCWLQ